MSSAVFAVLACGCSIEEPAAVYPDPTKSTSKSQVPSVRLVAPASVHNVQAAVVELVLAVTAPNAPARVDVVVASGTRRSASLGADGLFRVSVGLLPGSNPVVAHVTDATGGTFQDGWNLRYVGVQPSIRVLAPVAGAAVKSASFAVRGQALAAPGASVVSVDVAPIGGAWLPAKLAVAGELTTFRASVSPAGKTGIRLRVTDDKKRTTERELAVKFDDEAPTIAITSPKQNAALTQSLVTVSGTASDNDGIAQVEVRAAGGAWIRAEGTSTWKLQLAVPAGASQIEARATDHAGNTTLLSVSVTLKRVVTILARDPKTDTGTLKLTLTKAQLKALLPEAKARELVIYYMDLRPVLIEALAAIKDPIGYGVNTSSWGKAEWNMQKIVTMSPDNTDFTDTAFEQMQHVSAAMGIAVQLFSATISAINPTQTYLSTKDVADALFRTVLSSHPALKPDPADDVKKLPITMWDALTDLKELATTLGPKGGHPGVLYKAAPSMVLLPNFEMTVTGKSNLRQLEGIDLSAGKSWLVLKDKDADVVTFDFLDDSTFKATGIADHPQVDLFFSIMEHNSYVKGGMLKGVNPVGGFPRGNSAVWTLPKWTFEHLVADAVFHAYRDKHGPSYKKTWKFDVGTLKDASVVTWDKGWLTMNTVAGIGNPPPPGYWWDMMIEVAQVRLHDGGLKEGDANLRLAITGVTVPITGKEVIQSSRKLFEDQKSKLAEASIGDHGTYDTTCDVALVRNGVGMSLWFVASADIPGAKTKHGTVGLFADAALTTKLSSTGDDGTGDKFHEKLALPADKTTTVYARDRDGSRWRLDVTPQPKFRARVAIEAVGAGASKP